MDPYYGRMGWVSTFIYLGIVTTLISTPLGLDFPVGAGYGQKIPVVPVKRYHFSMKYPLNIYPHDISGENLEKVPGPFDFYPVLTLLSRHAVSVGSDTSSTCGEVLICFSSSSSFPL